MTAMLEAGLGQNATLTELDARGDGSDGEAGCLALAHWAAARFGVAPKVSRPPQEEGVALARLGGPRSDRRGRRRALLRGGPAKARAAGHSTPTSRQAS